MVRNSIKILNSFSFQESFGAEKMFILTMLIFDLTESSDNQNILYFENIDMNENRISGLDSPQNDSDAANKNYVDSEIGKLPKPDTDVLKLNGSRAMTGDLDMNNHQVDRVKSIFMNDSSSRLNKGEEASTTLELQLYQVML